MILREFFRKEEGLVFKGGTSLSKGYHLINRFSEDIDLNYIDHDSLNRKKRKEIKYTLKDVVDKCGLSYKEAIGSVSDIICKLDELDL